MKLLTISKNKAFTLIEVLVVTGILVGLLALGALVDLKTLSRGLANREEETLISLLYRARSRAMNNVSASAHGLYLGERDSYVLFEGKSYKKDENTNEVYRKKDTVSISLKDKTGKTFEEIYFNPLSGEPNTEGEITLSDHTGTKIITIAETGLIEW